jgi:hypothetical protein
MAKSKVEAMFKEKKKRPKKDQKKEALKSKIDKMFEMGGK